MSVHFISGKPGGGKTLYAVRLILGELRNGVRVVVTNVPLKLAELNTYLQDAPRAVDLFTRIIILSDEQTKEFWQVRPGWSGYERLSKADWQQGRTPDYSGVKDTGVLYVIDEVHNFFGSRQWTETGRDALFYLSQHRHLGDDCICITQAVKNVDRAFRSIAQDFTQVRNMSKERYGIFRLPAVFLRRTFLSEPSSVSRPMESQTFTLDVSGIAACYDTAAGVGIHAKLADIGEKRRGLPWGAGIGVVVALVILVCFGVPRAVAYFFRTPMPAVKVNPPVMTGLAGYGFVQPTPPPVPAVFTNSVVAQLSKPVPLRIVGAVKAVPGVQPRVWLADGSILTLGDGRLTFLGSGYALVDGQRLSLPR